MVTKNIVLTERDRNRLEDIAKQMRLESRTIYAETLEHIIASWDSGDVYEIK